MKNITKSITLVIVEVSITTKLKEVIAFTNTKVLILNELLEYFVLNYFLPI